MSRYLITGTKKDELIGGTPMDDAIIGNAGNDTVWGYGGSDEIGDTLAIDINRSYDDKYIGGKGEDILRTYSGFDKLFGGSGDDLVFAETDDSFKANGGKGFDVFLIDASEDDFYQEFRPGNDVVLRAHDTDQVIHFKYFDRIVFMHDEPEWTV